RFPWLAQGITGRGPDDAAPFDLGFFGETGGGEAVWRRWCSLAELTGARRVIHGAQLHGSVVRVDEGGPPGIHLCWEADGHVSRERGALLAVSLADCVPVYLVHPGRRVVCLIHAGWRGIAAGILERGTETLGDRLGVSVGELVFHAGPSICGECYEVGPEVHEALGMQRPENPKPVDLRRRLADGARSLGVPEEEITISGRCTRCGPSLFFSHRAGDAGRQVGFLGIRDGEG
ncbi:MAG: polyphenol oxidase family protein, partial [Longimicrobiales bacterium]|nr:polyphenol oxidase family protein [Longimicrobiales bacterium]